MLYGVTLSYDSDYAAQYNAVDTLDEYDLALAQDDFELSAPELRTDYKTVRGMDGALDVSDSPQGYPTFENRELKFKLFHRPPFMAWDIEELMALRTTFMARWQGRRVRITLPDDPTHYWVGRLSVGAQEPGDGFLHIEAVVYPYKLKNDVTSVTITDMTTSYKTYTLANEDRYVVPEITIAQDTTIQFLQGPLGVPPEIALELPSGETSATFKLPYTLLVEGTNQFQAKIAAAGTNSLVIAYREGTF